MGDVLGAEFGAEFGDELALVSLPFSYPHASWQQRPNACSLQEEPYLLLPDLVDYLSVKIKTRLVLVLFKIQLILFYMLIDIRYVLPDGLEKCVFLFSPSTWRMNVLLFSPVGIIYVADDNFFGCTRWMRFVTPACLSLSSRPFSAMRRRTML